MKNLEELLVYSEVLSLSQKKQFIKRLTSIM